MSEELQTKILTLKGRAFFAAGSKTAESKEAKLGVHKVPTDIIVFVPGTTDPINHKGLKHEALNSSYFKEELQAKVGELKSQFIDLHIFKEHFSWSGDNNTNERIIASERLLEILVRYYSGYKYGTVHLHLIGHSHGGNVINQFTELIANEKMINDSKLLKEKGVKKFPKKWEIKSITYLSTPFFKEKHQLNHTKLHKECKIINVYNEYDITQRFVADFSLLNLEIFINNLNSANFALGQEKLEDVKTDAFKHLYDFVIENEEEGPFLWRETSKGLSGIGYVLEELIKYVKDLEIEAASLENERKEIADLLIKIKKWVKKSAKKFNDNKSNRKGGYGRSEYLEDLKLDESIGFINQILKVENNGTSMFVKNKIKDSYLLKILAKIFNENGGLTDSIDDTSWNPEKQAGGLEIIPVPITKEDTYKDRNKKETFESFAKGVEDALKDENLEEVLMRLFSQFIPPKWVGRFTWILKGIEAFIYDNIFYKSKLEKQIELLGDNIDWYNSFISKYHKKLITEKDKKDYKELETRPGSIPYFATVSHSLSHTQLWPEVEEGLKNAFSSGKNSGYNKTK